MIGRGDIEENILIVRQQRLYMQSRSVHLLFALIVMGFAAAQGQEQAPFPGRGLAQHPFLYCGEWQKRSTEMQIMYLVRDGRVVWSYTNERNGELGDCTRLSNGNIVFSRQFGASEITPDKEIVWDYDAPKGTEIHTTYPLGRDRVLVMQNGNPAKALIIRKATNKIEKELILSTKDPTSTHGQFRHIRMTNAGTFLVAHMDLGEVVEYAPDGHVLWSVDAPKAWAAVRLANGNTLISGNEVGYVREVNPRGEIVWEIKKHDLPGIPLFTVQEVSRLANGNTLINNWSGGLFPEQIQAAVQLIEVTPDKKVVWALKDWVNLGPASSTQLLDEPGIPENGDLQR
jgi:hypothetical protein